MHYFDPLKLENNSDDGRGNDHENRMEILFLHNKVDDYSQKDGLIVQQVRDIFSNFILIQAEKSNLSDAETGGDN